MGCFLLIAAAPRAHTGNGSDRASPAKFSCGKRDIAKGRARIVLARGGAFLLGEAIFACRDQELTCAYQTDDGEKAQGHDKEAIAVPIHQAARLAADLTGDIAATTAATAF